MQNTHSNGCLSKVYFSRHLHGLGIAALALLSLAIGTAALPQTSTTPAAPTTTPATRAQKSTITTLSTFNGANGIYPGGLTLSGSTLYGISGKGGAHGYGVVFLGSDDGWHPHCLRKFRWPQWSRSSRRSDSHR